VLAFMLTPLAAAAQFVPHAPAKAAYCLNPSGVWVPIATSQTASQLPNSPPASDLYGINGTNWFGLACDANGNLSAGSILGYTIPTLATGCLQSAGTTGPLSWATCGGGGSTAFWIADDFLSNNAPGMLNWTQGGIAGGFTWATATSYPGHNGIWLLDGGSGSNSFAWDTITPAWSADGPYDVASSATAAANASEVLGAGVANGPVIFGLAHPTANAPNPSHIVGFICNANSGGTGGQVNSDWFTMVNFGSYVDTGVSCLAWHLLEVSVTNLAATYYIDGLVVGTGGTATADTYAAFYSSWNQLSLTPDPVLAIDWYASKVFNSSALL
jgi:hypothetical protein